MSQMEVILWVCLVNVHPYLILLTPLENWDVSNGIGFTYMFSECSSLSDIKASIKRNVKERFDSMFEDCSLSKDSEIKELLEKWKNNK